jgi:hypothetical protein
MTATLPINVSTPFGGLGTASATIVTAGLYTLQFKTFLPYLAAGTAVTSARANNIVDVTCAADSAGSKNSTWWKFYSAGDAYGFYVWYNINSAGVDPAPTGLTGVEVAGATGASAATLATATIAAIAASTAASYVTAAAGASGHLVLTNKQYGSCTAATNGTASYGATFSVTQAGSDGVPAASGLVAKILQNSTVIATYAFPTPTQPIVGGSAVISASAADTISLVLSSNSVADASLNAVKTVINLFAGE